MTAYEFIKECGVFHVLTVYKDAPSGRPFGALMQHAGKLYIATGNTKPVYRHLTLNPNVQLLAIKPTTGQWARVTGTAEECDSMKMKEKMLEECPALVKYYPTADCEGYTLFAITIADEEVML